MSESIEKNGLASKLRCSVCTSVDTWEFFQRRNVPCQDGVVWPTREEALKSPLGDIKLTFCKSCGFIWNSLYDPSKVQFTGYDFSLHYSPLYQSFISSLAERLVGQYELRNKTVLDLGCGRGHFLKTICHIGQNNGIGIDPSFEVEEGSHPEERITFIKDYYSPRYAHLTADFVSCRHVFDELEKQREFLELIREALSQRTDAIVYFELPNADFTFGERILWNIGYAKRSWFTSNSLMNFFELAEFRVLRCDPCFGNAYLGIEAVISNQDGNRKTDSSRSTETTREILSDFTKEHDQIVDEWATRVDDIRKAGLKAVAWGAGARAILFLTMYDLSDAISYVVDINPKRQGMFLPRTAHQVFSPDHIKVDKPDLILITNPTYENEIRTQAASFGFKSRFLVL